MTSTQRRVYAERVKLLRQAAGLRQEDLAAAAGVSRPTIIGIENGTSIPQQEKLVRILAVLGVDVQSPRFGEQTERWLTMMGALIEAIPVQRREPAVNAAIRELTDGIRAGGVPTPEEERKMEDVGRNGDTAGIDELGILTKTELGKRDFDKAALRDQEEGTSDGDDARPSP
jgi:transcriptional regulator with XRE-family HTH domain